MPGTLHFMTKLIIWVPGKPNLHGYRRRDFAWSEKHKCFVHDGKEYTPDEFNAVAEKVFRRSEDMHPCVRAFDDGQKAAPVRPAPAPAPLPVATITAREITEEDAVATLMRLAPHRLKKSKQAARAEVIEVAG